MCGIVGVIRFDNKAVTDLTLTKMMQVIKHRGPDDEGTFVHGEVGLGFVRLSIIDLSPAGHQPMFSDDERFVIVYNGEVYNYIELKQELESLGVHFNTKTDTEVVLKSYLFWGDDCQDKFNGMWAFVIYDKINNTVFASRDRFGIKPFYYIQEGEYFAFASEIPALLAILDRPVMPDKQVIFDYLVYNRTDQTASTFFSDIKKLQHGQQLCIQNGQVEIKKWYDLQKRVDAASGFGSADEYKALFSSALALCLRSDVPIGVCLSGGIDSSAIASTLVNELKKKDIISFSAVYKKGQKGDESEFIDEHKNILKHMYRVRPTAQEFQEDINVLLSTHAEPIPSTSPYAQFKVMQLAKTKVTVTIGGQGADEQLAGYHDFFGFYFKELFYKGKLFTLILEIYYYIKEHKSLYALKTLLYFLLPLKLRALVRVRQNGYLFEAFLNEYGRNESTIAGKLYGSDTLQSSLVNHFEYKLEHLLKWEDNNSMHFSIESRVPFLDYRLVEKTLASANKWKIQTGITKYILRQAMKNIMPERVRTRKDKVGFETPQDEWFRTEAWSQYIKEIVSSASFKNRNIIDPEVALKQYEEHLNSKKNISKDIWKWIHLELWFRKYIDPQLPL